MFCRHEAEISTCAPEVAICKSGSAIVKFSPGIGTQVFTTSRLRTRRISFRKLQHTIKQVKVILFDVAMLIIFIAALVRLVKAELGW